MSIPEYQQWHVTQLVALGLPVEFAQSFTAFVRDTTDDSTTLTDTNNLALANDQRLDAVEPSLSGHIGASSGVHGATGDLVGNQDLATPTTAGVVQQAQAVTDAVQSTVTVTAGSAGPAPATYSQTHSQNLAGLSGELRVDLLQVVSDLNAAIVQFNDLLAKLRQAGVIDQ